MTTAIAEQHVTVPSTVSFEAQVHAACLRIAPLWALRDMVAVNPYLGLADGDLLAAEDALQRRHHAAALPEWALLRTGWQAHEFTDADLSAAGNDNAALVAQTAAWLDDAQHLSPPSPRCLSIAAVLAQTDTCDWLTAVVDDLGRFMAAHSDRGVGRWALPDTGGLWASWRAWMRHDRSLAMRGVRGVAAWVAALPEAAPLARTALLEPLKLTAEEHADYLGRLLGEVQGWAGWLRQQAWARGQDAVGELPELLTIRLALDVALHALHPRAGARPVLPPFEVPAAVATDRAARALAVRAWEQAHARSLIRGFRPVPVAHKAAAKVQVVFCIDVRSEGFRRQLEGADDSIETYGFAGFFAIPVAVAVAVAVAVGSSRSGEPLRAQCPVLLSPGPQVNVGVRAPGAATRLLGAFRRSAVGGFAYMETVGLTAAWSLLTGTTNHDRDATRPDEDAPLTDTGITADTRLALLRGMLSNLGLARPYARLVVLCGHDSSTANNPQAAGLACGACGGHSGAVNARLAARLYNDPQLRAQLGADAPPAHSVAVAAVHDTATDLVRILDLEAVPASHHADLAQLRQALATAGAGQRAKRAPSLPGVSAKIAGSTLLMRLLKRSRDWAELRPEWGLADNAAFIAAPRALTAGCDLNGRCFLHSYEAALDPDGAVLGLILTAPVVVASWINLQYWASTIDPARLGSGNKAIHTIVGGIGVCAGSSGDLLPGLALQSVHDGAHARHRPLRLQVFVAAEPARMDAVIASHAHLRDLVTHGWISLHSVEVTTVVCHRRWPDGTWRVVAQ